MSGAWTLSTAIDQITRCGFECEAGDLANNVAWAWLVGAAKNAPEFMPGTRVWYEVTAEVAKISLTRWVQFTVVGCMMSSDQASTVWRYSLSNDPPSAYHYGEVTFSSVAGDKLSLTNPSEQQS